MTEKRKPTYAAGVNPHNTKDYVPRHGAAGSDLPPRGAGLKSTLIKRITKGDKNG